MLVIHGYHKGALHVSGVPLGGKVARWRAMGEAPYVVCPYALKVLYVVKPMRWARLRGYPQTAPKT